MVLSVQTKIINRIESTDDFLTFLGVSDETEVADCKNHLQRSKEGIIVRVAGGGLMTFLIGQDL